MKIRQSFWLSIAVVLLSGAACAPVQAKKWVVKVKDYNFTPYNLTHVKIHDTIQWVWEGGIHTTTSVSVPPGAEPWDNAINQDTTSFIYIPIENGIYFYRSTPDIAREMNGQFTVSGASGDDDIAGRTEFGLFPNPFRNRVCVNFPADQHGPVVMEVFDLRGNNVGSAVLTGTVTGSQWLDTRDIPPGISIFRYSDTRGTTRTVKGVRF
jgi:plastocyanin